MKRVCSIILIFLLVIFLIAAKYYQPKSIVAYNTENLLTKTNKVELHSPVQAY